MDLYKNLKKDVQLKERWNKQEKILISNKAKEISSYYQKLKLDMMHSEDKLKKMIIKNSRVPIEKDDKSKLSKSQQEHFENKIFYLTKDNLYLKKELLRILNQIMGEDLKDLKSDIISPEKEGIIPNISKEGINLKGSILSFSNNNINDMSLEKIDLKNKIISPEIKKVIAKNQDDMQGSAVINIKRFKILKTMKQNIPRNPKSLQVSKVKSIFNQILFQIMKKVKSTKEVRQKDYLQNHFKYFQRITCKIYWF